MRERCQKIRTHPAGVAMNGESESTEELKARSAPLSMALALSTPAADFAVDLAPACLDHNTCPPPAAVSEIHSGSS